MTLPIFLLYILLHIFWYFIFLSLIMKMHVKIFSQCPKYQFPLNIKPTQKTKIKFIYISIHCIIQLFFLCFFFAHTFIYIYSNRMKKHHETCKYFKKAKQLKSKQNNFINKYLYTDITWFHNGNFVFTSVTSSTLFWSSMCKYFVITNIIIYSSRWYFFEK